MVYVSAQMMTTTSSTVDSLRISMRAYIHRAQKNIRYVLLCGHRRLQVMKVDMQLPRGVRRVPMVNHGQFSLEISDFRNVQTVTNFNCQLSYRGRCCCYYYYIVSFCSCYTFGFSRIVFHEKNVCREVFFGLACVPFILPKSIKAAFMFGLFVYNTVCLKVATSESGCMIVRRTF